MEGSIRVSAKTVDDAITEALIQLGVTSDRLGYNVIEKGSAGFLGIGMKQAVIEAWRKKVEKEDDIDEKKEELVEDFKKEVEKELKKDFNEDFKREFNKDYDKDFNKDRRDFKKDRKDYKKDYRTFEKKEIEKRENPRGRHTFEIVEVTEETVQAVEKFLGDTLKAMGMEVEIVSKVEEDGCLSMEMKGENMGILIGKRGQTLDSLQYLANRVANKHQSGYVRVKLDTENYRQRREETLRHLAKNIAYKVKRNRKPVGLEPMNPYERRIIHSALQSDPYVTTHSEGEEPYRKVVVTLKR